MMRRIFGRLNLWNKKMMIGDIMADEDLLSNEY